MNIAVSITSYSGRSCTFHAFCIFYATRVFELVKVEFSKLIFFRGATAPSEPGPPHYRGFTITLSDTHTHTRHSVGLLWASDQPDAETST